MDGLTPYELSLLAGASGLYLSYHLTLRTVLTRVGRYMLLGAWALQLVDIGFTCVQGINPVSSTPEAVGLIAWLIVGGFLGLTLRYRLSAAGAFVAPTALALLVMARVLPAESGPETGALGLSHIFLSTLGVSIFASGAIFSLVYLLQERQLKRKNLARAQGMGPSLATWDRLAARCVTVGFPVFTTAIVTGAIWIARLGLLRHGGGGIRPEYVLSMATWVAFGALLIARAGAGWQGRRAAWLTLAGFLGTLTVVAGYLVRHLI